MQRLSKAETEIIEYMEQAAVAGGAFYFPEEQRKQAFDLAVAFGKIGLSVHGGASEYGGDPGETETVNRIAGLSSQIGGSLLKKIPLASLTRMERELGEEQPVDSELTPREAEVLQKIALGLSEAEICKDLFISEGTLKKAVASAYKKQGLANRVEAALYAFENYRQIIESSLRFDADCVYKLTPSELRVLEGLGKGRTNRQIAKDLRKSNSAVSSHVKNIYEKIDIDRSQFGILVRMAEERGHGIKELALITPKYGGRGSRPSINHNQERRINIQGRRPPGSERLEPDPEVLDAMNREQELRDMEAFRPTQEWHGMFLNKFKEAFAAAGKISLDPAGREKIIQKLKDRGIAGFNGGDPHQDQRNLALALLLETPSGRRFLTSEKTAEEAWRIVAEFTPAPEEKSKKI